MKALVALLLVGCAGVERPACSQAELARIEAECIAKLVAVCQGYSYDDCPLRDDVEAECEAREERWASCR